MLKSKGIISVQITNLNLLGQIRAKCTIMQYCGTELSFKCLMSRPVSCWAQARTICKSNPYQHSLGSMFDSSNICLLKILSQNLFKLHVYSG